MTDNMTNDGQPRETLLVVTTNDGQTFRGVDAKEVVRQMRNTQWGTPVLKRDYMTEVVARVESMTNTTLAFTDAASFLRALADVGFVTITTEVS